MIIEPPKTLEDFLKIEKSIIELINSPWLNEGCKLKLKRKLEEVRDKIKQLEK